MKMRQMKPLIRTKNLVLRHFHSNDAETFYLLMRDSQVNTFLPVFPPASLAEAEELLLEKYVYKETQNTNCSYAICLEKDDLPIGYVNISGGEGFDLGYGLRRDFWGKGLVTEACKALILPLQRAGLPYITATHDVNNPASGRVMQKIGMHYCYSYLEQWQPKNIPVVFRMYQINLDGCAERVYRRYWDISATKFVEPLPGSLRFDPAN